jgi:hypothetical protein
MTLTSSSSPHFIAEYEAIQSFREKVQRAGHDDTASCSTTGHDLPHHHAHSRAGDDSGNHQWRLFFAGHRSDDQRTSLSELSSVVDKQSSAVSESSAFIEEMNSSINNVASIARSKLASAKALLTDVQGAAGQLNGTARKAFPTLGLGEDPHVPEAAPIEIPDGGMMQRMFSRPLVIGGEQQHPENGAEDIAPSPGSEE